MEIEPPKAAVANGHEMRPVWDSPHFVRVVLRWTCTRCPASAQRVGVNEYGTAVAFECRGY